MTQWRSDSRWSVASSFEKGPDGGEVFGRSFLLSRHTEQWRDWELDSIPHQRSRYLSACEEQVAPCRGPPAHPWSSVVVVAVRQGSHGWHTQGCCQSECQNHCPVWTHSDFEVTALFLRQRIRCCHFTNIWIPRLDVNCVYVYINICLYRPIYIYIYVHDKRKHKLAFFHTHEDAASVVVFVVSAGAVWMLYHDVEFTSCENQSPSRVRRLAPPRSGR